MKKKFSLLVAGSLLAVATLASAGNKAETFSISPVIGGYLFDGKQHLESNVVYGLRAGYNFTDAFGVEALLDYLHNNDSTLGPKPGISMYHYGAEMLYHFIPDSRFVPYVAAGVAGVNFDGDSDGISNKRYKEVRAAFDYGVGAKYFITDNFALRADVRNLIYKYDKTYSNLEYTVGAYIPFGGAAPAIKPVEPPPAPAPVAAPVVEPPPAPVPIPAPTSKLSIAPDSIIKGQSTTISWTSQNASNCDIQPGIGPVMPQGSMMITPAGTTAYTLVCKGEGGAADSAANISVATPAPEPAPVIVPPPPMPMPVAKLCSPTVLNIKFDTNKADIKPQYHDELKSVADFLKEFPMATGVIEGHTDSVGSPASNLKLSQRRADSVRSYLIKTFGIAPERISAKGYGETKPIASNKSAAGKQQNRRIEANFNCNGM